MSSAPTRKLTPIEYLAIEKAAAFKSEFLNGEMFAMVGASRPHNRVKDNLIGELHARLKGGPRQSFSSDQRVLVDRTGLYTYPDILIVCGPVETAIDDADTITNPRVIVEVLSPSTERYDRGAKFRNYQQIPSLTEYLLVAQDEAVCERFVRLADGTWTLVSFVGMEAEIQFAFIPLRVPMTDIYAGVEFPPATAGPSRPPAGCCCWQRCYNVG